MLLKAPDGCGSVGWGGESYPVVKGVVEVPDQAQELLEPGWGFIPVAADPEAPETKTEKAKGPQAGTPAPRK